VARPRQTENHIGTVLGAAIGGLVGGPLGSVIAGAGLGALAGSAANPRLPLPLEAALRAFVLSRDLTFVSVERRNWNKIRVTYGKGSHYFYVDAAVAPNPALYADNKDLLDDALYDAACAALEQRIQLLGL
jgi:hypothetical protein